MSTQMQDTLFDCFADLVDPRTGNAIRHNLIDIVSLAILAIIAGADDWEEVEAFAEAKHHWLATFLELPGGVPSHDTFARVFARLDPAQMQQGFGRWLEQICGALDAQVVAIDGKTLRSSFDRTARTNAIHVVSAWAVEHRLVLAQKKTDHKSNEIPAIKALIAMLELRGCTVSIDAMGCQKEIAQALVAKQADYVLALKKNQPKTYAVVDERFDAWRAERFATVAHTYHRQVESGHGRIERREYWTVPLSGFEAPAVLREWAGVSAIGLVESSRKLWDKTTQEVRYYLLSREMGAEEFGRAVRSHWAIENSLHWVLDVTFGEDDSRVRKGNGAENLAILRRLALSVMKQHPGKGSLKKKRFRAGLSDEYLLEVLRLGGQASQSAEAVKT